MERDSTPRHRLWQGVESRYVFWAVRLALSAVGVLILACPGHLKMKSDLPEKTTNVKITQPVEIKK